MSAALLLCLVVGITDGDTLKVRCGEEPMQVVRLAEIDAPEKGQAFSERSRQHLAELCHEKSAEVQPQSKDRYGRTVARVACAGQDASSVQLQAGMAWAFPKYLTDKSLAAVEATARADRRGLWADQSPIPPWEWRALRKVAPAHPSAASAAARR